MNIEIQNYNQKLPSLESAICDFLANCIDVELTEAESKIWHAHPVWFLEDNPIVGYSLQKRGVRLMFWSGADFGEETLDVLGKKFKDASVFYENISQIDMEMLQRCLKKAREIQWDYKNVVKRKGVLEKLK